MRQPGAGEPLGERASGDGRAGAVTVKADGFGTERTFALPFYRTAAILEVVVDD